MRLVRVLIIGLALGSTANAVEPKATISGPSACEIGQRVWLDFSGTASDAPVIVVCEGPDKLAPRLSYGPKGDKEPPEFGSLTPYKPGHYRFIVVAIGLVDKDIVPSVAVATWDIDVVPVAPAPRPPDPNPGPSPSPPIPTPAPILIGYDGPLWGVLVLPSNPTPQMASLESDLTLRQAFVARSAFFQYYPEQSSEVQSGKWPSLIQAAGGTPCVVWIKADGTTAKAATKATNRDAILNDLKAIRGK